MMTIYLSSAMLFELVDEVLPGSSWRDKGLVESAAVRPMAEYGGIEVYPTIHEKAAALTLSLVTNHPLIDGNKRLGFMGLAVFLRLNGYRLIANDDSAYSFIIQIAAGELREIDEAANWIKQNIEES
jgi:death-on-curing protein